MYCSHWITQPKLLLRNLHTLELKIWEYNQTEICVLTIYSYSGYSAKLTLHINLYIQIFPLYMHFMYCTVLTPSKQ